LLKHLADILSPILVFIEERSRQERAVRTLSGARHTNPFGWLKTTTLREDVRKIIEKEDKIAYGMIFTGKFAR
jgi:hypothetical protein